MSNHTPAPWTIRELQPDNDGEQEPSFRIEGESTLFLIVTPCSDGFVFGQNEANARLIAASPDLLAACECQQARDHYKADFVGLRGFSPTEYLAALRRHGYAKDTLDETDEFIAGLRDNAIARAKGDTP